MNIVNSLKKILRKKKKLIYNSARIQIMNQIVNKKFTMKIMRVIKTKMMIQQFCKKNKNFYIE